MIPGEDFQPQLDAGADAWQWTLTWENFLPYSMNEREGFLTQKDRRGRVMSYLVYSQKRDIEKWINAALEQHNVPAASGPRRVHITFQKGKNSRARDDRANLAVRTKNVMDALTRAGALVDDSEQWCELTWEETRGVNKATIIYLRDMHAHDTTPEHRVELRAQVGQITIPHDTAQSQLTSFGITAAGHPVQEPVQLRTVR